MECFGQVRSMATVRLPGANTDCLALGSDSGRLALVHYIPERDQFERIHLETYGKTGCRRTVAGQYMAADPAGRALMIAAIEKQRIVYTFDRDSNSLISISSPIEANRPGAITFSIAALDVGNKSNPVFAAIELAFSTAAELAGDSSEAHKLLTFYEVDLSSKPAQVVKRASEPIGTQFTCFTSTKVQTLPQLPMTSVWLIDPASNMLIAVPGGAEGPGTQFTCFTGTNVQILTQLRQAACWCVRRTSLPTSARESRYSTTSLRYSSISLRYSSPSLR